MEQNNVKTAISLIRLASELNHDLSVTNTGNVADDYRLLVNELMGIKGKEEIALELLRFNAQGRYYNPADLARIFRGVMEKLNG